MELIGADGMAHRNPNPNGVELTNVRPPQGRNFPWASDSVGFTYGYSRYPASRESDTSIQNPLQARVARACFEGPRLVPDGQGEAADLQIRSAPRLAGV